MEDSGWCRMSNRSQTLGSGGVGEDCVAERCIWRLSQHRSLHRRHEFARLDAKCRQSENFIALRGDHHLQKTGRFGESSCAHHAAVGILTKRTLEPNFPMSQLK